MVEAIFTLVIMAGVALVFIGIGIYQVKSKEPVGFYSGETPPAASELTDVKAWNVAHGRMWIIYGCIILATWGVGVLVQDSIWVLLPYFSGMLIPLAYMIWNHHRLIKKYKR